MTRALNTDGLLPVKLRRLPDGSVEGTLPDGKQVQWDRFNSRRPTKRHRRVMLNCYWWRAEWQ